MHVIPWLGLGIAVWLIYAAFKNIAPIAALKAILANPADATEILAGSRQDLLTSANDMAAGILDSFAPSAPIASAPPNDTIAHVIAVARAQIGKPYVLGTAGPDTFDCSGLCQYSYAKAGVRIPRTTYDQIYAGTKVVGISSIRAGDLCFPNNGHVFMALTNKTAIEAPRTGLTVRIIEIPTSLLAIRRIVP
jgi:cell wall-associated NlpC family hydrolase